MERQLDLSVANYGSTRDVAYALAVLPWGATEPHNMHLPYLTDAILSHDIAVDAAVIAREKYGFNVMVMPPLPLGSQNPGQRDLKFCVHYRHATQMAVLSDIASSLYNQGIDKLVIINGHGGNTFKGMIRDLAVDMPGMLIASSEWFKVAPAKEYFDNPGDHADELETSVMMHYHPELVRLEEAGRGKYTGFAAQSLRDGIAWLPRDWSKVSTDTGIGDPSSATAAKGAAFAKVVAERYADLFADLARGDIYLSDRK